MLFRRKRPKAIVKFNAANGGPAPERITDAIYAESLRIETVRVVDAPDVPLEQLVNQGIGFTAATTGELWKGHPEKALGLRNDFIEAKKKSGELNAVSMKWLHAPLGKI